MSRLETQEEKDFVEKARVLGCLAMKLEIPGHRHWPDRICLVKDTDGRVFFLEFKRKGESARKAQRIRINKIKKLGYQAYVADNILDALEILEDFIYDYQNPV